MSDMFVSAERGYIYEWVNPKADDFGIENRNLVLVVSSNRRSKDNIISILFLTTDRGNYADDIVRFNFHRESWIVRTDLVTYTNRRYLTDCIGSVSESTMKEIDEGILKSLGLYQKESIDWQKMYNQLLDEVIRRG